MGRALTRGEREMLLPIFGQTIPYERVKCEINVLNFGGMDNSITPNGNPYFSVKIYCNDFSADNVELRAKRTFVHELMHVWQYYHGVQVSHEGVYLFFKCKFDYDKAYDYRELLKTTKDLKQFNIEQQAALIAGYWVDRELGMVNLDEYRPFLEAIRQPYHIPRFEDNAMLEQPRR